MNGKDFEIYNYQFLKNQEYFDVEHLDHFSSNENVTRIPKPRKYRNFRERCQKKGLKGNLAIRIEKMGRSKIF